VCFFFKSLRYLPIISEDFRLLEKVCSLPNIMRGIESRVMNMWDGACDTHGEKRITFLGVFFGVNLREKSLYWRIKLKQVLN
jgi:hypothetical protein